MFGLGVKDGAAKEETCISTESCHAGIPGSGPGQLQEPTGIAVAGANLWVVDRANNRVEEFSAAGAYLNKQIVTSAPPYRTGPNGVALDAHGDLFVTGYWFGQIQKFSVETGKEEANVLTYINGYRSQEGVAVDQQGNVWVADWVQPRARVL
jgi:sugar lactone lactonase YvrE